MSKQQPQQPQQGEPSTESSMVSSASSYMSYVPTATSSVLRNRMIVSSTSSLDQTAEIRKLEQIVQNFYTKAAHIILQARVMTGSSDQVTSVERCKVDKWFNLTVKEDIDIKEKLKFWKSSIRYQRSEQEQQQPPPPLIIDIYLQTKKHKIVLESWALSLSHPPVHDVNDASPVDSLPALYKKSIVFFRALHSLVKLLPCHSLYQRMQQLQAKGEDFVLNYRLSTSPTSKRQDEISLVEKMNSKDVIRSYDFRDIPTPLGTFKLKLLFRENHKGLLLLDSRMNTVEKRSFIGHFDIDENFFAPSTIIANTEENLNEASPVIGRLQSYRSSQALGRSSSTTTTTTSIAEKRMSVPVVRPFKSPSVSSSASSHQQADLLLNMTNATSRQRSQSLDKKTSFSSSFDKFFKSSSQQQQQHQLTTTHDSDNSSSMTKRWSRMSDIPLQEDEESLEAFMKLMGAQKELKLFQLHYYSSSATAQLKESNNATVSSIVQKVASGGIKKQLTLRGREKTTKSLSYFRNRQEAHAMLTDSMSTTRRQFKPVCAAPSMDHSTTESTATIASQMSLDLSSSFSTKSSINLPLKRAPRYLVESSRHAAVRYSPLKYRQLPPSTAMTAGGPSSMPLQRGYLSNEPEEEEDDSLVFKMSEELNNDDRDSTRQEEGQHREHLSLMPSFYYDGAI